MTDQLSNRTDKQAPVIQDTFVREAIKIKEGEQDVVILECRQTPGSTERNHFLSVAQSLTVTSKVASKLNVYELFVKTTYKDEGRKKLTLPVFQTEATVYSKIIPKMTKLQIERAGYIFGPSVPEYYHSIVNQDMGMVMLRNYQPDGYSVTPALEGFNYEHYKLVMKEMAVFHALSWAMKNESSDNIKQYQFLSWYYFNENPVKTYVQRAMEVAIELIMARSTDTDARAAAVKVSSLDLDQTLRRFYQPTEPYAVICHGDCHFNNMLFKHEVTSGMQSQSPVDLKVVDLQTTFYALPTTDLAFFFYTSTNQDTRKKHLTNLLRYYHTEFHDCLKKLNLTFDEFTFKALEDLFLQSAMFGVLMSFFLVPILMSPRSSTNSFAQNTTEDLLKEKIKFVESLPQLCDRFPNIQRRLFDNWTDLVEMCVFKDVIVNAC